MCVNKDNGNHSNPHEAIKELGWIDDVTGQRGRWSRLDMYNYVVLGGYAYVKAGTAHARLIAETSIFGTPYVKTVPDATKKDNLLSLDECHF